MLFRKLSLAEYDIHQVLSNPRRSVALDCITNRPGPITLRELSEIVATRETGESPAPRSVRQAVYVSLHQHHLPAMHRRGIIHYDVDRKLVEPLAAARDVELYMEVTTKHGITWAEYYRLLGVLGLLLIVGSLVGTPLLAHIPPLLLASGSLAVFSLSTAYQYWNHRHAIFRLFQDRTDRREKDPDW